MSVLEVIRILPALLVLAESLNKLERTAPCACGITPHERLLSWLKALAWFLLAMWSAGAIAPVVLAFFHIHTATSQFIVRHEPALAEVAGMWGFAVLIVRTRIKEG